MPRTNPPALNLPAVVTLSVVVLVAVHVLRGFLGPEQDAWVIAAFSFIPARYGGEQQFIFPGGAFGDLWSFATYALLHADFTHILVNCIWLVAFGGALAKRIGTVRFLLFSLVTAAAGAATHLAAHWGDLIPVVGASAAISGHMAAAIRFALSGPGLFRPDASDPDSHLRRPAVPLLQALQERQVIVFLAVWFGVNFLFGVGSFELPGQSGSVAWEAHLGGFVCGLLLFRLFDPIGEERPA